MTRLMLPSKFFLSLSLRSLGENISDPGVVTRDSACLVSRAARTHTTHLITHSAEKTNGVSSISVLLAIHINKAMTQQKGLTTNN